MHYAIYFNIVKKKRWLVAALAQTGLKIIQIHMMFHGIIFP